ncbi:hypothetical protein [Anderseniella sp. Alg231-50]|uniref:hypothetical protein n=1 Tax=Anderseniella sp. Alg231-50 TaxID=1922226 RepID=UPI00307C8EA0
MVRKLFAVSATALMLMAGSQIASAAAIAPGVAVKAPIAAPAADGSYKVAKKQRRARNRIRRNRRKRNRRRNLGIGLGLTAGAIAIGAVAAAAREREEYRACRRIERRCARRHGWETRRWYRCVENRDC